MNQNFSSAELKNSARELLRGKYPTVILTMLLASFLSAGIKSTAALLMTPANPLGYLIYYSAAVIFWAFSGMFSAGIALFFLKICCRQEFMMLDIFYGFTSQPKKTFSVSLVFSILNLLCGIPTFFVNFTAGLDNMELYMKEYLVYLAVTLLCNVLYSLVTLGFSQVYFLMIDFPELSVKELFLHSIGLMRGNLMRYLLLEISFIPFFLLGIFSCGIGLLWITPYIQTVFTLFYLDLMKRKATS